MPYFPIRYNEPLFRPPAEADSLILQITLGCTWNKCTFCEMYSTKKFIIRDQKEIEAEIESMRPAENYIKKIFLADGNPFVLSSRRLLPILKKINNSFSQLRRISTYALPKDILSKSMDELIEIRNAGISLLYVGIESGDDEVLKMVNKSETYNSTVDGLLKAQEADFHLSVMILNGLGGSKYFEQHALNSARILNAIQPKYASTLVLMFPLGIERFKERFRGNYIPMTALDSILEMKLFMENTDLKETIFRSNHASNYLVLKGVLSKDKERLMNQINMALNSPEESNLREEWQRGL